MLFQIDERDNHACSYRNLVLDAVSALSMSTRSGFNGEVKIMGPKNEHKTSHANTAGENHQILFACISCYVK